MRELLSYSLNSESIFAMCFQLIHLDHSSQMTELRSIRNDAFP